MLPIFPTPRLISSLSIESEENCQYISLIDMRNCLQEWIHFDSKKSAAIIQSIFSQIRSKYSMITSLQSSEIPYRFLPPNSLLYESNADTKLYQSLNVSLMKRLEFYRFFLSHAYEFYTNQNEELQNQYAQMLLKLLLDIASYSNNVPNSSQSTGLKSSKETFSNSDLTEFYSFLRNILFVPTETKQLSTVHALYDPTNHEIKLLLRPEFFPSSFFISEDVLNIFRSLGMKTVIDWKSILDCAKSVERIFSQQTIIATQDISVVENLKLQQLKQSKILLSYLDTNIARLLGEDKKSVTSATQNTSASFFNQISNFSKLKNLL
jgi:hypothetical protein